MLSNPSNSPTRSAGSAHSAEFYSPPSSCGLLVLDREVAQSLGSSGKIAHDAACLPTCIHPSCITYSTQARPHDNYIHTL